MDQTKRVTLAVEVSLQWGDRKLESKLAVTQVDVKIPESYIRALKALSEATANSDIYTICVNVKGKETLTDADFD